jgi:hypothetical protein
MGAVPSTKGYGGGMHHRLNVWMVTDAGHPYSGGYWQVTPQPV